MKPRPLDEFKRRIPLLDYLQSQQWRSARSLRDGRWLGMCPLHRDHKPSFLIDPHKNLFYCYGCGRGGDVIRFVELYYQVPFREALALLRQWCGIAPLLRAAEDFYRLQWQRYNEPQAYLEQRGIHSPAVIEHMRFGYAAAGGLHDWLTQLGYPVSFQRQAGFVNAAGNDAFTRCITVPLESNLYGRSTRRATPSHRFLPGSKGGLYSWESVRRLPDVILVEGLFDYATLWQAGFHQVTCSLGNHLNARQFQQLCDGPRTVYLAFDADANGSGPQAAQQLSRRLFAQGLHARQVCLPTGHDPNSFFAAGGTASEFRQLLERACP
jgi:DNA primase